MKLALLPLLALAACATPHPAHAPGHSHHRGHRFVDAEQWATRFEDPERDAWQKPDEVVALMALEPGHIVADVGSGTGYFARRIAPQVARVWGADIEPEMVRYLNDRARKEGLENLFSILARPDDPLLPEPVDRILVVNTYHHVEGRPAWLAKLRERIREGGWLVIVEYEKGELPQGPPDAIKLAPEEVRAEAEEAGWTVVREETELLEFQYVSIFE